jgi:hypothetical protein
VLVLLAAAAVIGWSLRSGDGDGGPVVPVEPPADVPAPATLPSSEGPVPSRVEPDLGAGPEALGRVETGPPAWSELPKVFEGTASITVEVEAAPGVPFPGSWTLHVEPSPFAEGREHAIARELVHSDRERTVEVRDLPMAAYRVYASAPGLATLPQEVLLHKIGGHEHLPGVNWMRVKMTLQPAATVSGHVVESDEAPAEGVPVTLRQQVGERRHRTETGANGTYTFAEVLPGTWLLFVGDPDQPHVAPRQLEVVGGNVEVPVQRLPPLVHVRLQAIDHLQRPLPNTAVSGYRTEGGPGSFRAETGPDGTVLLRHLAPGAWRLEGRHEALAREGRADLVLVRSNDGGGTAADPLKVDLYLAPRE